MARLLRLLVLAAMLATPASAGAPGPGPRAVVERLNAGLLEIMRHAGELGYDGRVARFSELLGATYNLPAMAKATVGPAWAELSEAERERLLDAFRRMTVATYASRFTGYSGERFEVTGQQPSVRDLVLVRSRLIRANGEAVALDYTTKDYGEGWRIVDVSLDAKYSELARLRAEFGSVLRREGLDGLLSRIEARIQRSAAEG